LLLFIAMVLINSKKDYHFLIFEFWK